MTKPFGAETLEEKAAVRARLLAEGHSAQEPQLTFAVERAWEAIKAGEPTYRERQYWHAMDRFLRAPKPKRCYLTTAELDYLLERLNGVNDPLGVRCVDVLTNLRNRS